MSLLTVTLVKVLLLNVDSSITNWTATPFPIINNCTENVIPTFNKLRDRANNIKHISMHPLCPPNIERPIAPICTLPDYNFSYHFLPNFYCETMNHKLFCDKDEELNYLKRLYSSLNGDKWKCNKNWLNESVDYCEWHGIYCCNTSYPLYTTCINMIDLDNNTLNGTLPTPWPNSTVLTIFSVSDNYIKGTIPDYHELMPNLSFFAINADSDYTDKTPLISGTLPSFPKSNCMFWFDVHNQVTLGGQIPEWNSSKYLYSVELSHTNFSGTIPSWSNWLWPYHITMDRAIGTLRGTIPPFTNALCPTLDRLFLYQLGLSGTVPPLPPQLYDVGTAASAIFLHGNVLSGSFPWESLDHVQYLTLQDNDFHGNIQLNKHLKRLIAINISNNNFDGMFPCFMNQKELELIDARFNKFTSIATAKNDGNCNKWPKSLNFLLLSNNEMNADFELMMRNSTNFTVLDVGNNRLKGTVPSSVIEGQFDGQYISIYDNDISCTLPYGNARKWIESWLYVGHTSHLPFAPYTNDWEKGLGIIAFAPKHEIRDYMIAPLVIGLIVFIIYSFGIKYKFPKNQALFISVKNYDDYQAKEAKHKILYIMQQTMRFLAVLLIIGIIMFIIYIKGAQFVMCGYQSLQPTIAYLGTQDDIGYNEYSWISLILFAIYSIMCTLFVVKLCYLTKWFAINTNKIKKKSKHKKAFIPQGLRLSTSSIESMSNREKQIKNSVNNIDEDYHDIFSSEITQNEGKCNCCYLWIKVIVFMVLLFGPMTAYNIYHSIPYSHTKIPDINSIYFEYFVLFILPGLLAIGKFFGVPYGIHQILLSMNESKSRILRRYENAIIYVIRLFTVIFIPIIVLFIFDDGCRQNWKSVWNYCEKDENDNLIHNQCEQIFNHFHDMPLHRVYVCHAICNKAIVGYRCIRRFIQVLAPLYLYKMNIALWFPFIYYLKQTENGQYVINKFVLCWKRSKECNCCGAMETDNDENKEEECIKMDVEYMSLVSSLEIVIVFGWAIPLLILLYAITIYGYWCVYSYWFNNEEKRFRYRHQLEPVTNGLIFSLIMQHVLAICFYGYTQSEMHAIICFAVFLFNLILFLILLCSQQTFKRLYCYQ